MSVPATEAVMKLIGALLCVSLVLTFSADAHARSKKRGHRQKPTAASSPSLKDEKAEPTAAEPKQVPAAGNDLDFDFFGHEQGASAGSSPTGTPANRLQLENPDLAAKAATRRWMLTTHQTLGISTWALMVATVVVGQLNYNQLYGGGGGSLKYQTAHRWLVVSTSAAFAATASFAIFAPSPYERPLRFDTGLIHRIAVIGATAGMLAEIVLGWAATHRAEAGNPNHLRTYARAHQVVGYTTLGFLTVAGVVWLF